MILNITNVESLVFYDDEVWNHVPDLRHFRDQWRISKLSPSLRLTGRRALSGFLDAARGCHEQALAKRFGTNVTIDTIDSRVVVNLEFLSEDEFPRIDYEGEYSGFTTHRDADRVYLTLWR